MHPLCNGIPERAPQVGRYVFPLCYRCSGLMAGLFVPVLVAPLWLGVAGTIPMLFDVALQKVAGIESTNFRRFVTGYLFTAGAASALESIL